MSTIHVRIDEETKRLAMQAAEERRYQNNEHEDWLEQQIIAAFSRYDSGEGDFISNDEMENRMDELKAKAARGEL